MPKPYSIDLRGRVIEDVESGASRREAAELWAQPKCGSQMGELFRRLERCGKAERREHVAVGEAREMSARAD